MLDRAVVPDRLALVVRGHLTAAYNPRRNVWHLVDDPTAETLRWLRAGRPRAELAAHLSRRFDLAPDEAAARVHDVLVWCVLRRLLYLDAAPPQDAPVPPVGPESVYWISTQACNLRCTYCYQDALVARPQELTTEEALDLVDQVVEIGARTFVITGGEPFSRRDLRAVAEHSRACGLRTNVITNGHFVTGRTVDWIAATFDLVTISLDHLDPAHHDRHRGSGSWRRARAAIGLLADAGARVEVNSVLTAGASEDLEGLVGVGDLPIGRHKVVPQFPMGRGGDAAVDALSPAQLLGLDDALTAQHAGRPAARHGEGRYSEKGRRRDHCGAGLSEVSVDPEGWVYPCRLLQHPEFRGSNVREQRLAASYGTAPTLRAARARTTERLEPCRSCVIRDHCGGGCRGIHVSFTGDAAGSDPLFCAYLRRSFEAQMWEGLGQSPPPRRTDFRGGGVPLPIVSVSNGRSGGGR